MQVPASGQPMLLMADGRRRAAMRRSRRSSPRTSAWRARLAPGDRIQFAVVHAARRRWPRCIAQERPLLAIEARRVSRLRGQRCVDGVRRRPREAARAACAATRRFTSADRPTGCSRRDRATRSSTRSRWPHERSVPVTMLGGGSNVLVADCRRPRARHAAARRRHSPTGRRARPRRRGGDDQRPRALDDQARRRRPRGVGRHARNGRRRDFRQRALRRPADRRAGRHRVRLASRDGVVSEVARRRHGVRIRSQPAAGRPARCCCRRTSPCRRATRPRCARWRGDRWRSANARSRSTRRARAACSRIRSPDATPCRTAFPWSAGALVDRAGLKGARVGGARVSPTHGNFIVNEGTATAADIRRLIERCRARCSDQFGVELREEIVYLGDFDDVVPPERDDSFANYDHDVNSTDQTYVHSAD